jgi:hypothetical protein
MLSVSSFLPTPEYLLQINDFMLQDGLQVQIVPVPEPAGTMAVMGIGIVVWRRSRHRWARG